MKRFSWMFLVLAAILIVGGCKKGRVNAPQNPVPLVSENDLPSGKTARTLGQAVKPADRRITIYIADLNELAKRKPGKNELEALFNQQKAEEAKDEAAFMKKKDAFDAAETRADLLAFGRASLDFCRNNSPSELKMDQFAQYLRRNNKNVQRRYLDKKNFEIVVEQVPLRSFLEKKIFTIVYEANVNDPKNVIAFPADTAGQSDHLVVFCDQQLGYLKDEAFDERIWGQELRLLWGNFMGYKKATAGGQLTRENFNSYLLQNAPPSLLKKVQDREILVTDPAAANEWFACQKTDNYKKRAHYAIRTNGLIEYIPGDSKNQIFK